MPSEQLLKIPLTREHLDDAIKEAKRWFIAKKGVDKDTLLTLSTGTVQYPMPDDCDAVIDVAVQDSPLDISLIFSPNLLAGEKVPYSVFAPPSSTAGGLYSSFVQALQYTEMAKRIIGAEFNWQFFPYRNPKILLVLPNPVGVITCLVQYKSSDVGAIDQLPERDHDLIKRFALAWAKRDLGEVYSRYSTWPGANGPVVLNGPQLLAEAKAEFERLEFELFGSAMPMPFLFR
jgi:hypothetical protein